MDEYSTVKCERVSEDEGEGEGEGGMRIGL